MTRWGEIKCPRCKMLEEHLCLTEEKLERAVDALRQMDVGEGWAAQIARTTLAELTGGKDA